MTHPSAFSPQPFPDAPARRSRYPGDDDRTQANDDEPDQDAPTDGRQFLGWASEAGPGHEGDRSSDRGRRRDCTRRSSNGPRSRSRRPTGSPGAAGAAPPIGTRPGGRPGPVPTPRADAWRARMPERFNDWTLRQRAVYRKIWLEEVMAQLRPGPGSGDES